jgi:hypothetical protein
VKFLYAAIRFLMRRITGNRTASTWSSSLTDVMSAADEQIKLAERYREYNYPIDWDRVEEACRAAVSAIDAEIEIVKRKMANACEDFVRAYKAWFGVEPLDPTPRELPEQVAVARRNWLAGAAAAGLELLMATFVLTGMEVGLIVALTSSAILTFLLVCFAHGAILATTGRRSPLHSLALIKKYILAPALVFTIPVFGGLLFTRFLSDLTADWLPIFLPFLQIFLWAATIGLILLGAALLSLAEHHLWSQHHVRNFDQLERLTARLEIARSHYDNICSPRSTSKPPSISRAAMLAVLILSGSMAGCSGGTANRGARAETRATPTPVPAELVIMTDVSGSLDPEGREATADNLKAQLLQLIKDSNAHTLTIETYGRNGRMGKTVRSVPLPRREKPNVQGQQRSGETKIFPGVEKIFEKANKEKEEAANKKADEKYQADLDKVLSEITPVMLVPSVTKAAHCSDIGGALSHISDQRHGDPQIYIVITDAEHTCGPLKPVAAPPNDVKVLMLQAPSLQRKGQKTRLEDQYESRRDALLKAAPWLVIRPANERHISGYIGAGKGNQPPDV